MEKETVIEKKLPDGPTMSEIMFAILNDYYEPAYSLHESQDMKSTQELLEEMECMQEVYPWEINKLMADGGYKMQYTGSGYAWLLKKRK